MPAAPGRLPVTIEVFDEEAGLVIKEVVDDEVGELLELALVIERGRAADPWACVHPGEVHQVRGGDIDGGVEALEAVGLAGRPAHAVVEAALLVIVEALHEALVQLADGREELGIPRHLVEGDEAGEPVGLVVHGEGTFAARFGAPPASEG